MEQPMDNLDIERSENTESTERSESIESKENLACMICGQHQVIGIHICDEFICEECEREIVNTDVRDAKYPFFIHRMKQMFHKKNA